MKSVHGARRNLEKTIFADPISCIRILHLKKNILIYYPPPRGKAGIWVTFQTSSSGIEDLESPDLVTFVTNVANVTQHLEKYRTFDLGGRRKKSDGHLTLAIFLSDLFLH